METKKTTGHLSRWIAQRRDGPAEMSPEAQQLLGREMVERLARHLGPKVSPKFGLPSPEEMASDEVVRLLERLDEGELDMPDFVVDTRTLFIWMCRSIWSRFCKLSKTKRFKVMHGLSAGEAMRNGKVVPLGMQGVTEQPFRGAILQLDKLCQEDLEVFEKGLEDCRTWFRATQSPSPDERGWDFAFEQVVFRDGTQREVAAEVDVNEGTLGRWMERAQFCIVRRMGWDARLLGRAFGVEKANSWSASLRKALGASA